MPDEIPLIGLIVQQHVFVVKSPCPHLPGGLPRRLLDKCDFVYDMTNGVVLKSLADSATTNAFVRVVNYYDSRVSHISEIQEALNIALWP